MTHPADTTWLWSAIILTELVLVGVLVWFWRKLNEVHRQFKANQERYLALIADGQACLHQLEQALITADAIGVETFAKTWTKLKLGVKAMEWTGRWLNR